MFDRSVIFAIAAWVAASLLLVGGYRIGRDHERTRWEAKVDKERAEAEADARVKERMWQEVVNGTVKNYEARLKAVRADFERDLAWVRSRPVRAFGVSEAPRPACAGGTGAELSGGDAEFLVREAARADELRAGISACYAVIDGVRGD